MRYGASPEEQAARYDPHPDYASMSAREHAVAGVPEPEKSEEAQINRTVCELSVKYYSFFLRRIS